MEVVEMEQEKVKENRLRRMAERQRLALRKSRRRDPHAYDYGRYWLIDPYNNWLVAGDEIGMTLDAVEAWLLKVEEPDVDAEQGTDRA